MMAMWESSQWLERILCIILGKRKALIGTLTHALLKIMLKTASKTYNQSFHHADAQGLKFLVLESSNTQKQKKPSALGEDHTTGLQVTDLVLIH